MYSPDITNAVIDTGNRDLIEMYTKSAIDTSNNLPEFRNAAAAITETRDWAIAANVQVGSDGKLILSVDRSKIRPPGVAGASIWDVNIKNQIDKADKAVSAVNSVFSQLGQLLDAENVPKEEQQKIFQQYLQNLSVDFTSAKQKDPVNNFFGWLADKAKAVTIEMQQDTGTKDLSKAPWDPAYNFSTDINTVADNTSVDGVTAHYLSRTRHHESGGNDNADNPLSSASGRYQFIDTTYNAYAKKLGLTGSKNDPINQELVMNAYTKDSADMLSRRGIEITDANLYLMHLLGQGGGLDFLENSYDNELLTDVLSGKVYRSNQKLFTNSNGATLTVGQLKDKIQSMYN